MDGWIKIHRKILDWSWYKEENMFHLFAHLLLNANREDKRWKGMIIKRGQLVTGRKELSVTTGISEQSVRTCLDRLKSTSEITSKSTNKFSIITIIKYEDYQLNIREDNQQINQLTNQQLTSNQPTTNHKQEEEEEKGPKDLDLFSIEKIEMRPEYKEVLLKWLHYKRKKKQSYKDIDSIKLAYKKLLRFSNRDPKLALQIVEQSMANNWAGFFELREVKYKFNKNHPPIYADHIKYVWDEKTEHYVHSVSGEIYIP